MILRGRSRGVLRRRQAHFLSVLLLSVIAGCAETPRIGVPEPESRLTVLGPVASSSVETLPGDWTNRGRSEIDPQQVEVVRRDGIPALRVQNGKESFVLVRRIDSALIVTPYLSWSWNMGPYESGIHPVRLIVGFHGGAPDSHGIGIQPLRWLGSDLPPHDRAMSFTWGDSALQRGSLTDVEPGKPSVPRYVVRGGREHGGTWWLETLDIAQLYGRAWPGDAMPRAKIVFIGIASEGGRPPSEANFSGILLSR